MRHHRINRPRGVVVAILGLICLATATGCTHNHYYGYNPCQPGTTIMPSAVSAGPVCEVPAGSSSSVARMAPSDPVIVSSGKPPRVVVSQPGGRGSYSWRAADPEESRITTTVGGGVGGADSSVR